MTTLSIPPISNEELMRRYLKIKPVVEVDGVKYWLRDYTLKELRNRSYIWYARPDKTEPVDDTLSLCSWYEFQCLHTYGYPGFFKPSIAEVLTQIPGEVFGKYLVDAFEIVDSPVISGDLNKHKEALNQGFHVSVVRLYIRPKHA